MNCIEECLEEQDIYIISPQSFIVTVLLTDPDLQPSFSIFLTTAKLMPMSASLPNTTCLPGNNDGEINNCQARVQVQGLSPISKRPGPNHTKENQTIPNQVGEEGRGRNVQGPRVPRSQGPKV